MPVLPCARCAKPFITNGKQKYCRRCVSKKLRLGWEKKFARLRYEKGILRERVIELESKLDEHGLLHESKP